MIEVKYTIAENAPIASGVYRLKLEGDTSAITAPGQFLDLRLPGFFLRRPISICDWDERSVTLLYKVVGGGTDWLSRCTPGQTLDALSGLGNGFDVAACGETTLLSGGGIGTAPLFGLAKRLLAAGKTPVAVLGFNTAEDVFYENEFKALGVQTVIATADGSCGTRGFVTDALPELRLRADADAQGALCKNGQARPDQSGSAHGLRLRRVHGLHDRHGKRPQARLP